MVNDVSEGWPFISVWSLRVAVAVDDIIVANTIQREDVPTTVYPSLPTDSAYR
jgi:hypothetical protein